MKLYALRVVSSEPNTFKQGDFVCWDDPGSGFIEVASLKDADNEIISRLFTTTADAEAVKTDLERNHMRDALQLEVVDIDDLD